MEHHETTENNYNHNVQEIINHIKIKINMAPTTPLPVPPPMSQLGPTRAESRDAGELLSRGLQCSICIDFYCEPLTLSCGHSYVV